MMIRYRREVAASERGRRDMLLSARARDERRQAGVVDMRRAIGTLPSPPTLAYAASPRVRHDMVLLLSALTRRFVTPPL